MCIRNTNNLTSERMFYDFSFLSNSHSQRQKIIKVVFLYVSGILINKEEKNSKFLQAAGTRFATMYFNFKKLYLQVYGIQIQSTLDNSKSRDDKKNSNYRDFELSKSLNYQEKRKKFELLRVFIIFLKIFISLHKFYI